MTNTFYINGIIPQTINFNGAAVSSVYYNNVLVWSVTGGGETPDEPYDDVLLKQPVTFTSPEPFSMDVPKYCSDYTCWNGTMEYSKDGGVSWTTWNGNTITAALVDNEYKLSFRGTGNTHIAHRHLISYSYVECGVWRFQGSNIKCAGNIENLLDYKIVAAGEHPVMDEDCFYRLFNECSALTDASDLLLPATTLAERCYSFMFIGCSNLIEAPELLPATTLKYECYRGMFYNCSSLTKVPKLSATILTESCCSIMFYNCTSLIEAPKLPATILTYECYAGMFHNCSSLTKAPELPAITLAERCYATMFVGCSNLVEAPELPATTLAESCYGYMFENCDNLITLPSLSATILPTRCYEGMFEGCTKIKISETQTAECPNAYRIPSSGTITSYTAGQFGSFLEMFGTSITIEPNTTYYTNAAVI